MNNTDDTRSMFVSDADDCSCSNGTVETNDDEGAQQLDNSDDNVAHEKDTSTLLNSSSNNNGKYNDFLHEDVDTVKKILGYSTSKRRGPRGGVVTPFPVRLHDMLERTAEEGLEKIVCWQPHGRCFIVRRPNEFVHIVLPR